VRSLGGVWRARARKRSSGGIRRRCSAAPSQRAPEAPALRAWPESDVHTVQEFLAHSKLEITMILSTAGRSPHRGVTLILIVRSRMRRTRATGARISPAKARPPADRGPGDRPEDGRYGAGGRSVGVRTHSRWLGESSQAKRQVGAGASPARTAKSFRMNRFDLVLAGLGATVHNYTYTSSKPRWWTFGRRRNRRRMAH
jgi:hypothetical protein